MIMQGHNPRDLLVSSIISIPKDIQSSLSDSNNYRGISLYNAICKVYDIAIICLCYEQFVTSDMQFGFKSNTVVMYIVVHEMVVKLLIRCTMANCLKYCWIKSSFLYYQIIIR